ncbi:MAG: polysaccharide deacetylase family protein [Jatrophihabitans sp.]
MRNALHALLATLLVAVLAPVAGMLVGTTAAWGATGCPPAGYGVHRYAPGNGKTVALTFDDGPGRDTGRILAILRQYRVPATFFNLGANERSQPTYVRAEAQAGFALGSHTWDHANLIYDGASGQASEMDRERSQQAQLTGAYPCLFRPPYGSYNSTTLQLAQNRGMAVWNWSVDTEDWKAAGSGAQYWVDRIASRANAGGSQAHPVVLMHNQPGGNPATVAALPRIMSYYQQHGYRFVDLLGRSGPPAISTMSVHRGGVTGGTSVTVTGAGFFGVQGVTFGGVAARSWRQVAAGRIVATAPAHAAGGLPVRVVTTFGTSVWVHAASYLYVGQPTVTAMSAHTGGVSGGTAVTISGTNFQDVRHVTFGGVAARSWHLIAPGRIAAITPTHPGGLVPVRVATAYGTSVWVHAASYVYTG